MPQNSFYVLTGFSFCGDGENLFSDVGGGGRINFVIWGLFHSGPKFQDTRLTSLMLIMVYTLTSLSHDLRVNCTL